MRPTTVAHRIDGILGKIGVADRSAATAYAVERGSELQRLAEGEPATRVAPASPSWSRGGQHPVVILFSDVAGSTALIDRLGDSGARVLLLEHDHIIRDCLATHGGTRIKHTGDGVFASFILSGRCD